MGSMNQIVKGITIFINLLAIFIRDRCFIDDG